MSAGGAPCGACKFLRRKCVSGCVFAPYFDQDQGAAHFAAVHKIFGASNVSKLLLHIPVPKRCDAVVTICYEAEARLKDPVYGCVGHIFALQQQVVNLQAELASVQARLAEVTSMAPPAASYANSYPYDQRPDQLDAPAAPLSISVSCQAASSSIAPYNNDRPPAKEESSFPWHCNPTVISPLFEPPAANQQQQQMDILQRSYRNPVEAEANPDDSELQALARELLRRQYTVQLGSAGAKALSS